MERHIGTKEKVIRTGLLVLVGLGAVACGASNKNGGAYVAPTVRAQPGVPGRHELTLTFDSLNPTNDPNISNVIRVYPGVGDDPADKQYSGRYFSGQTAQASCQTEGRDVASQPGESPQQESDVWFKIDTSETKEPDVIQYASAVYVQNYVQLEAQLPHC